MADEVDTLEVVEDEGVCFKPISLLTEDVCCVLVLRMDEYCISCCVEGAKRDAGMSNSFPSGSGRSGIEKSRCVCNDGSRGTRYNRSVFKTRSSLTKLRMVEGSSD